jgi:hypothetical protein
MHTINLSLEQGIFPNELKLANVIPIFKAGDDCDVSNYRPVSLLTTISKIYEQIFYNRLLNFFVAHNILYNYQFGFRRGHSTFMAMLTLMPRDGTISLLL